MVPEPFRDRRIRLSKVARLLIDAAHNIDRRRRKDMSPPITPALLRGVARSVHGYLSSSQSFKPETPESLDALLGRCMLILAGPKDAMEYTRLAESVDAFDENGEMCRELLGPPPARASRILKRLVQGVEQTSKATKALTSIVGLLIAIFVFILGRESLESLLQSIK